MNDYVNIFNESMEEFLNIFSNIYNLNNKDLIKKYKYSHKKKRTGYMLFIKDLYKEKKVNTNINFTKNSKIISEKWKILDKNIKQVYNNKALLMNKYQTDDIENIKKITKELKEDINNNKIIKKIIKKLYNDNLDDTKLEFFYEKDKKYIKDNFNNIIEINDKNEGKYIGIYENNQIILIK
jgi:hypothetical protein